MILQHADIPIPQINLPRNNDSDILPSAALHAAVCRSSYRRNAQFRIIAAEAAVIGLVIADGVEPTCVERIDIHIIRCSTREHLRVTGPAPYVHHVADSLSEQKENYHVHPKQRFRKKKTVNVFYWRFQSYSSARRWIPERRPWTSSNAKGASRPSIEI